VSGSFEIGEWKVAESRAAGLESERYSGAWALVLCVVLLLQPCRLSAASAGERANVQARTIASYGKLPLYFETNRGQAPGEFQFLARGRGYSFLLGPSEAVMALQQLERSERTPHSMTHDRDTSAVITHMIRMQFAGCSTRARMAGVEELSGKVNYLIGSDPSQWQRGLSTFASVKYEDLYPGIDLFCYGSEGRLEYDFAIAPGVNPGLIALQFTGVERLDLDTDGNLLLHVPGGQVRQHKPIIYQKIYGLRKEISGGYVIGASNSVSFQIGPYDHSKELIIDPILGYSTFIGGGSTDRGADIAVDAAGSAYVAGETLSVLTNLVTPGAFQTNYAGGFLDRTNQVGGDAFIAKLKPSGAAFEYFTYLGGSGNDGANAIVIDSQGNACITGFTDSTNFPTTVNALQTDLLGTPDSFFGFFPLDGFVAKLDANGSSLLYSTYLGGDRQDEGVDIAVDSADKLYVTGFTQSTNFPVTPGAGQMLLNGRGTNTGTIFNDDAFVAKIDPTASGPNSLIYSTYFGFTNIDRGDGIAVDASGSAYVTGVIDVVHQLDLFGNILFDAFVVKIDPTGSTSEYFEILHGPGNEGGFRIALDSANNAYVTGSTELKGAIFRSVDAGSHWSSSRFGFFGSLAIDPSNPSTLYAGTGNGVIESTSAGATWFRPGTNALGFHAVTALEVDPTSPSTLYAGTRGGGVFKSEDAGVTWTTNSTGALTNALVAALLIDPNTPSTLYAGTLGNGVFKSPDAAVTWTNLNLGLGNLTVRALAAAPLQNALYAGTLAGVFRSTNGGTNWQGFSTGLSDTRVNALVVDPINNSTLYVGTEGGLFKSINRGTNWTLATNGLISREIESLAINPQSPANLYAGTTNGVFETFTGGALWQAARAGLVFSNVTVLAIDPVTPANVYAVASGVGDKDAFVAKFDPAGQVVYSTFIGGTANDEGWDIAVDAAGNAYVTGVTSSTNFPTFQAPGPQQTTNSGGTDAFVLGLDPNGAALLFSFYLGGKGNDFGYGIALDPAGNAYVTGQTISSDFLTNVMASGAIQPAFGGGGGDVFVTKILTAQPALLISRSGENLVLSWRAPTPEFQLEANDGMQPGGWIPITQTPAVVHGMNTVTLGMSPAHQNFRLRKK
jgi:photosystem II stability/assembly factor-like uncharacterized protein